LFVSVCIHKMNKEALTMTQMRMIHSIANSSAFDAQGRKTKQIDFKISFDVNKLKAKIVCVFKGLSDIPCEAAANVSL
jgi:hypothetical protein